VVTLDKLLIGTAGWSVDRQETRFSQSGSALERYASIFSAVEVNSSFYRRHRPSTWQRWYETVPADFLFAVKLPKVVTHDLALVGVERELDDFISDVEPLRNKLGAVLIQLPPRLKFAPAIALSFMQALRDRTDVPTFVEPRHVSWASAAAEELLVGFAIKRVYADPQLAELQLAAGPQPGYLRLHGSPKVYYSEYTEAQLRSYASLMATRTEMTWCIFDNTASGAALRDALKLFDLVDE
jgi:uncharacterized protein YecE (DUF72 family)